MFLPPFSATTPSYREAPYFEAGPFPSPVDGAPVPFNGGPNGAGDGVGSAWWSCGSPGANGGNSTGNGMLANLSGLLGSLVSALQQLLGGLSAGASSGGGNGYGFGGGYGGGYATPGQTFSGDPGQRFANVTISSSGDPHIAETGTQLGPNGAQSVNQRYDSMVSQPDLVSANIAGGYRVATTVTQPNAKGITWNQSATVEADHGRERVTMNNDGSFSVSEDGRSLSLARGQTLDLAGGETVTENQNGSLLVSASNGRGGSIATTLSASGGGVDVTTTAQQLQLGGAVVQHPQ
jgi:hypothetical protein